MTEGTSAKPLRTWRPMAAWVNDKSAEVRYSDYSDPEAAGGGEGTARLVDGQWTFEFFTSWNS